MKLHEVAKQPLSIKQWLENMGIINYSINHDAGVVDVHGPVTTLYKFNGSILPVQFGTVDGYFVFSGALTSLQGVPHTINGGLSVQNSRIKSLLGIHKIIKHIGGAVSIDVKQTHILGLLLIDGVSRVGCSGNFADVIAIEHIMNKYLPTQDVIMAQDELIDAGFIEQAKL